ncbi:hypothetical protein M3Y97_00924600 [Aphelenchoides bicaudatus]|nr:hypothetical protein M3Y97_00924600 [Aphelenchoides bicaudatus]
MAPNSQQMKLSSLQHILTEHTKPEFLRRLDAVYWDARQMEDNFVHYGGKIKTFEREFCENVARQLQTTSFEEQAAQLNCHIFDIISAYCDFITQCKAPPCDLNFDLSFMKAASQQYIKLDDTLDFMIMLLQNAQTSVVDLYLKEFWTPAQVLIYCTVIHCTFQNYELVRELDSKWDEITYEKVQKPSWSATINSIAKSVKRDPYRNHKPENVDELEQNVDYQIVPGCAEMREFVQESKQAFDTIADDFLKLVGEQRFENMEMFKKKFCAYQLCDHLEIGFEKRMNLNEKDKLIVEFEEQFLPASYISWDREEGDNKIFLKLKQNGRTLRRHVEAHKTAMYMNPSVMCGAGTRVLAEFRRNYGKHEERDSCWEWGTLGSFPIKEYKFHYLVFFDNGAVRFVRPPNIRLCVVQPRDPDDDKFCPAYAYKYIRGPRREFIRNYFKIYPSWPLMSFNIEENAAQLSINRDVSHKKKKPEKAAVIRKSYGGCLLLVRYDSAKELCHETNCTKHEHDDEWIFAGDYQRIPVLKNIIEAKFKATDDQLDIQAYPENLRKYIQMLYPKYENENKEFDDLLLEQFKVKNTARKTGNKKGNRLSRLLQQC